jgi:hypothetical protein
LKKYDTYARQQGNNSEENKDKRNDNVINKLLIWKKDASRLIMFTSITLFCKIENGRGRQKQLLANSPSLGEKREGIESSAD